MKFIGISGFGQPPRLSNGIKKLVAQLNEESYDAWYYKWDDPIEVMVGYVGTEDVCVFGHSFGGDQAIRFARALVRPVQAMLLADAVAQFDAELKHLTVPQNVLNVWAWMNWGSFPRVHATATKVHEMASVTGVRHMNMDEYKPFWDATMGVARGTKA